jgi:hypothetical protein
MNIRVRCDKGYCHEDEHPRTGFDEFFSDNNIVERDHRMRRENLGMV